MEKLVGGLSMDRICPMSDLPEATCAHCKGNPEFFAREETDFQDFEVESTFVAQYAGICTINHDHRIRVKETVGRLRHSDNPFVPVRGYACQACVRSLPKAQL